MGITASSMACLRPLFQAFLSRSRLLGSSNQVISGWGPQRNGYGRDRASKGVEGFCLQGSLSKNFRSNPSPDQDLEAGPVLVREREGSTHPLTEVSSWDITKQSMTDVSSDEIRRSHASVGVMIVHAKM